MSNASPECRCAQLGAENAALKQQLGAIQRELSWLRRQIFGEKSEKLHDVDPVIQANLLAGLVGTPPAAPQASVETVTYQRRKPKPRGEAVTETGLRFDDSVPVEVIELPPEHADGADPENLEVVATKVSHRLAQRPGSYVIIEYRRPVVKDRSTGALTNIPAPPAVLERTSADVSVLAGLLVDKFLFHLPLHRQHLRLKHSGIQLSRMTLSQWAARSAELLRPIHDAQLQQILAGSVVAVDETPIKAGRKSKGKMRQAYFWPIYGEQDEVCFSYASTRAAKHLDTLLGRRFEGVLLADGYAAYEKYAARHPEVTLAQCWSHTRREFERAQEAEPDAAHEALLLIRAIYEQETRIGDRGLTGPQKQAARAEYCAPLVRAFWQWCDQQCQRLDLLPTNPLSKALRYALARVEALEVFLSDPAVAMDTNHLERALRAIPMGRRNWLFCWTELGAEHVGIVQSLLVSCRLQGVHPYTYLVDVLQRIDSHPASRIEELTPRRWKTLFADDPLRSHVDRPPDTS